MMVRSVLQWLAVLWMSHLVEMSSSLLVRTVSHEAQENRRVPPMCWMKIRPIFTSDKQDHYKIRIGIQSQLYNDCRRVLLPPLKREQVRHTIFIKKPQYTIYCITAVITFRMLFGNDNLLVYITSL